MITPTLLQDIIAAKIKFRARQEYGDYPELFAIDVTLDGSTRRIDLHGNTGPNGVDTGPESDVNIDTVEPSTLIITLDGTTLVAGTDYQLDTTNGVLVLTTMPAAGAQLAVTGTNYQFYTDTDLDDFLHSALLKHTHQKVVTGRSVDANGFIAYSHMRQTLATLPEVEYHPVAVFTAVEALWTLAGDAAYDINVTTADGTDLPRMQRYQSIMSLIESLTDRYKDLCWQIGNCGFWRIHDGGKLRRESLFTGRLIPLRAPREVDDASYSARILEPVDVPAGTLTPANPAPAQEYNPVAVAGRPWSAVLSIDGVNLTDPAAVVTATISAGSRTSAQVALTTLVQDPTHVQVSLTGLQTAALPPYAPWRVVVTTPDGSPAVAFSGTFLVESVA